MVNVGVLALQGGVRNHVEALQECGATVTEIRTPAQLEAVSAMVIPGGESTTIGKLLRSSGLLNPLQDRVQSAMPVMGTCAGMILSARTVVDGIADQPSLNLFDATVRRNGVGPQRFSSECALEVSGLDHHLAAVFIRPPVVESVGDEVEVLARTEHGPVLCAQGPHLFASFHPELTEDRRVHRMFLERV